VPHKPWRRRKTFPATNRASSQLEQSSRTHPVCYETK
jgi:hypothetical protein